MRRKSHGTPRQVRTSGTSCSQRLRRDVSEAGPPFATHFVIAPQGTYLIKGDPDLVDKYIDEHFKTCIYGYNYWKTGKRRGGWVSKRITCWPVKLNDGGFIEWIY